MFSLHQRPPAMLDVSTGPIGAPCHRNASRGPPARRGPAAAGRISGHHHWSGEVTLHDVTHAGGRPPSSGTTCRASAWFRQLGP